MELEAKAKEVMDECDNLIELAIKNSSVTSVDALSSVDSETAVMMVTLMRVYKSSKELNIMQAKAIDKLVENLNELKRFNEDLRKQNSKMQHLLYNINDKVNKL